VDSSRDQHDEHPVAPRYRPLDDLAVVRRSRNDGDAPLERVELPHAFLPAHADHLVPPVQRVPHHVLPELPRSPDDANPRRVPPRKAAGWRHVTWTRRPKPPRSRAPPGQRVEQQPSSRPSPPRRAPCAGKSASFPLPGLAQAAKTSTNLRPGWFTTAYFHRPDDLAAEIVAAGLTLSTLVGVEGAAWLLPGLPRLLADPGRPHPPAGPAPAHRGRAVAARRQRSPARHRPPLIEHITHWISDGETRPPTPDALDDLAAARGSRPGSATTRARRRLSSASRSRRATHQNRRPTPHSPGRGRGAELAGWTRWRRCGDCFRQLAGRGRGSAIRLHTADASSLHHRTRPLVPRVAHKEPRPSSVGGPPGRVSAGHLDRVWSGSGRRTRCGTSAGSRAAPACLRPP
jgi:hypothetical protein